MVKTTGRFIHSAPRKVRLVLDQIRGSNAEAAEMKLRFASTTAAKAVYAVLHSALAAAQEQDKDINRASLIISEAVCNEGPRLKRRVFASRGRSRPVTKIMSHIMVRLEPRTSVTQQVDRKE